MDANAIRFVVMGILRFEASSVSNSKESFAPLPSLAPTLDTNQKSEAETVSGSLRL